MKPIFFWGWIIVVTLHQLQAQPVWRELPNAPTRSGRHEDVYFANPRIGWVVNGGGEIHKTSDAGANWQLQVDFPYYLRSVGFADSLTGWVGTLDNEHLLYTTADGGVSWREITSLPEPRPAGICGISVVNDSVVYASGRYDGPARVIKTMNRGTSWVSIDLDAYASSLVDCYFWNVDSGLVVGAVGPTFDNQVAIILATFDGGKNWTTQYRGTRASELCWKISFPSKRTGYVSIETFHNGPIFALKTRDGGMTWSEIKVADGRHDMQGIGFATPTLGWIGGRNPTYETTDGGNTWRQVSFGASLNRFRMLNDTLGYAVGRTVYKYSIEPVVEVDTRAEVLPMTLRLEQNYPSLMIHFNQPLILTEKTNV